MPCSFKHEGDGRLVIDCDTGAIIRDVIEAQTGSLYGPTYTQVVRRPDGKTARHWLGGRAKTRTVRANIRIERPNMPDEHASKATATKAAIILEMSHEERVALGAEALAIMVASFAGSLLTQAEDHSADQ